MTHEDAEELAAAELLVGILGSDAHVPRTMIIVRDKDGMERADNVKQMTLTPDTLSFEHDDFVASIGTDRIAEIVVSVYLRG